MKIEGTYLDSKINHKDADYKRDQKRKAKLGFNRISNKRVLTKKFADNRQKIS